ncbi:MAG: aldose 1-epimerase [Glaciecola sp.]|jgi:aldose 1-epimerase
MPPNNTSCAPSIQRITLSNNQNMQVVIANYGARILSIQYKNSDNIWLETTLNEDVDSHILNDNCYMGATCGRVSNRIKGAQYFHKGKSIKLDTNEGENTLHGGAGGFSQCFWTLSPVVVTSENNQSVTLTYISPDGDQGFPGNLTAQVIYTLTHDDHLIIEYKASCDKVSPINMCNHAYFTLGEPSIHAMKLTVFADKYLPVDEKNIPTGKIFAANGMHNYMQAVTLGKRIALKDIDDCYVLVKNSTQKASQLACVLTSNRNKISLSISTNQIAMQVYSGNYLPVKYSAIALEAQGLVDAVNQPGFATDWVGPNQNYRKVIDYYFQSLPLYD